MLIDQHGRLRLADFLSPFCVSCVLPSAATQSCSERRAVHGKDRGEFCTSLQSQHPSCQARPSWIIIGNQSYFQQELQAAFNQEWQATVLSIS